MAQPVRKTIGDKYVTDYIYTMLIDGNALLKVSMKDPKLNTRGEHVGGIFQFLLQLRKKNYKKIGNESSVRKRVPAQSSSSR